MSKLKTILILMFFSAMNNISAKIIFENKKYQKKLIYASSNYELQQKISKYDYTLIKNFLDLNNLSLNKDNHITVSIIKDKENKTSHFKRAILKIGSDVYSLFYIYKYKKFYITSTNHNINNIYISKNDLKQKYQKIKFKVPLKYAYISSSYSKSRFHPILKKRRAHHGIDFVNYRNTKIYSTQSGIITRIGRNGSYGKYIRIKHSNGFVSEYGHLNKYAKGLKRGSRVKKGQHIAYLGNTGRSTGPHLHFGLKLNNKFVNPTYYFDNKKSTILMFAKKNKRLLRNKGLLRAIKKKNTIFSNLGKS
jgi:murein DD-endopeptidase MepM/ murein hydrolase activator NlpD